VAAGLQFVLAVDNDLFVGGKSAIDQRLSVADLRDGDVALLDGIVGLDDIGVNALLALLHHPGRDGQSVVARFQQQPRIHQFTRPQPVRGVGKFCLDLNRAGGLQDFIIDEIDFALVELDLVVLAVCENRERLVVGHLLLDLRQVGFGKREDQRYRLDLGHHHETVRIGRMNDVADVDLPHAGDA
jgi:hypothetical protein